ncbi:hypothetical protein Mal33_48270 [Rosistilla oblonga]|uniref:Uncharacterized protein n=2 Tax=Rosistilla oblonga TaxID=2527990 RepID=A0A518J0E3_9BACT|nr:hypothetical protein Mal33_48270 [Rosistilla oblonga]
MRLHSAVCWLLSLPLLTACGCGSSESPTAGQPVGSEVAMAPEAAPAESAPAMTEEPSPEMAAESAPAMSEEPSAPTGMESEMRGEPGSEMSEEMVMSAEMEREREMSMAAETPGMLAPMSPEMEMEMAASMPDSSMAESMAGEPYLGVEGELQAGRRPGEGANSEPEPEPEPLPSDYLSQAKIAFAAGMEDRAYDLLLAHLVAEPELAASSNSYEMVGWSDATKRPTWGLRLGVGINNAAVKHTGNMHPVREGMKAPKEEPRRRNAAGGGGGGSAAPEEMGMGSMEPGLGMGGGANKSSGGPSGEIEQHVGLVGEIAMELFAENYSNGEFGKVFASIAEVEPTETKPAARGMGSERIPGEMASAMSPEMLSAAEGSGMEEMMMEGMPSGQPAGQAGNPAAAAAASGGLADSMGLDAGPDRVRPGLIYLGVDRPKELMEKAKQAGLDAYLQIDVSVNKNEVNGWVYNESSVRWMSVATGKPIGRASKKINNKSVFQAIDSRELDPRELVRDDLTGVFKGGMEELRIKPLPSLTAEMVNARVGSLIMSPPENPLAALAEVRLYASQGLLTEDQVHLAFDLIMGDDGLILSSGSMPARVEIIEPFAPKLTSY